MNQKRSEASFSLPLQWRSPPLDAQKGQRTSTLLLLQYCSTFPPNTTGAQKLLTSLMIILFSFPRHCNGDQILLHMICCYTKILLLLYS